MVEPTPERAEATDAATGDALQIVRSAEQVALHLPIAGPGSRILAYAIDYLVILLIYIALFLLLLATTQVVHELFDLVWPWAESMRNGQGDSEIPNAILLVFAVSAVVGAFIEGIYFFVCERISGGRSIGKAKLGLRVVGIDGFPLSVRASLMRNLLRMVDRLPGGYVVGLVAMLTTSRGQRLGDLAAGTLVVRLDQPPPALELATDEPDTGPYRFSRTQLARIGAAEKTLLRETLRRLDTLTPEQAAHALHRTADVLRARLDHPAGEPADDLGFLRSLLAAIERS